MSSRPDNCYCKDYIKKMRELQEKIKGALMYHKKWYRAKVYLLGSKFFKKCMDGVALATPLN
jgi:hypothetical protein